MTDINVQYLFRCKTVDAYIFKILIELLHNVLKTACFEITQNGIKLRMMDSNKRTLIDLSLDAPNFNVYYFSENIENKVLHIGLTLNHFYKMLRSIKKRDQLILFIEENKSRDLGIEIIPKDFSRITKSYIKIQNIQNLEIAVPRVVQQSILISSSEFSKMCKDMFNMSNTIHISTKGTSIVFGCNVGNIYSREVTLGNTECYPCQEINSILFEEDYDTEQLSRILKISGLHSHLTIFCSCEMPILISSRIGILGIINIYIKSKRQLEEDSNLN